MHNLKIADEGDLPYVIHMLDMFHKESPYSLLEFNEHKVINSLLNIINSNKEESIIIISLDENKKEPIGLIIGLVSSSLFSDDKVATELAYYILPEHRSFKVAKKLIDAYEDWAGRVGATIVQMSLLGPPSRSNEVLESLYTRRGYYHAERAYLKEI